MWDDRYAAPELMWGTGPNQFLPPLVEDLEPGTALDVACGEGRNAIWLASRGWTVTAVDFSAVGLDKAQALAGDVEVEWIHADVTTFRSDRRFDLVAVFYLHLLRDDLATVFVNSLEMLAPGGTFFAVGHALRNLEDGYGGPPYPEVLWTEDQIAPLVQDLDVIELGERERYVAGADATAIDIAVRAIKPA